MISLKQVHNLADKLLSKKQQQRKINMEMTRENLLNQEVENILPGREVVIMKSGYRFEIFGDTECCAYQNGEFYKKEETCDLEDEGDYEDYETDIIEGEKLKILVTESNNGYYWPCATLNVYDENDKLVGEISLRDL